MLSSTHALNNYCARLYMPRVRYTYQYIPVVPCPGVDQNRPTSTIRAKLRHASLVCIAHAPFLHRVGLRHSLSRSCFMHRHIKMKVKENKNTVIINTYAVILATLLVSFCKKAQLTTTIGHLGHRFSTPPTWKLSCLSCVRREIVCISMPSLYIIIESLLTI